MDSESLLNYFRAEIRDTKAPYLWSDESILTYMDDAQKMFCRLARGIADARTESLVKLAVTAGDPWLPYNTRILKLRYATLDSSGDELTCINLEDEQVGSMRKDYELYLYKTKPFSDPDGTPKRLVLGLDDGYLRLDPGSSIDDGVTLAVYRLPLTDITETGQALEIPDQHHLHLYKWMAHLAYSRQDVDTYDADKAKLFEGQFRGYCELARVEYTRREHKFRTVRYGGL